MEFTTPPARLVVEIFKPVGLIVRLSCCVAETGLGAESVTCTVKVKAPAVVGVPEIFPETSANPTGNVEPDAKLQVSVPAPPVAASVALYAVPTAPSARVAVVTLGLGFTTTVDDIVFVPSAMDAAVIVTVRLLSLIHI